MRFCSIVGVEPTVKCLKGIRITIMLYQPTAMSCLSCSTIFWTAEYNSPRTFCLADYSVVFCDMCRVSAFAYLHLPLKLHTSPKVQPLGQIHYPFSYQLTGLVLHRSQHHLLLSCDSGYPCGPVSHSSFLYSQRHCYNHPSYR